MRHSPDLIARVIGQMDSGDENVRMVAFTKAHAMLRSSGTSFRDLWDSHVSAAAQAAVKPKPAPNPKPQPISPYLHEPLVGLFTRRHNGKRIFRKSTPPNGVPGRLRVISDVRAYSVSEDFRRMTLSFETADALYEPFEEIRSDPEWLNTIRQVSANGNPLVFR